MSQISPPIRILLVCAVAFMAAYMLFLRPKDNAGTPAAATPAPAQTRPVEAGGEKALPLRVLHALADRKVVALLFWSPKSADDKLVRKALAGIDRHNNKVLAHATNIKKIAAYQQITRGANVEQS